MMNGLLNEYDYFMNAVVAVEYLLNALMMKELDKRNCVTYSQKPQLSLNHRPVYLEQLLQRKKNANDVEKATAHGLLFLLDGLFRDLLLVLHNV